MNILLRSVFVVHADEDPDLFFRNYIALNDSGLTFVVPEHELLWNFIREFSTDNNHSPHFDTIRNHFYHTKEVKVLDQLELLVTRKPIVRGDFLKRLEEKAEDARQRKVQEIIKDAAKIVSTGIEIGKGDKKKKLHGARDSLKYIFDNGHDIVSPTLGSRLSGEITTDSQDFANEYEKVKQNPLAGIGQFTGIQQMDITLKGAKRYELWTHAAFTGGLKSTLMLNWAYNQAIYYKHSSLIFSLEMPYNQCRRILYAMHSFNSKFRDIRLELGIQTDPLVQTALPYQAIRDGELHHIHPRAEEFLFEHVMPDLNDTSNSYGQIRIEVADPDKSDFTVADVRSKAEFIYAKDPFSVVYIDHMGLMAPRKWVTSTTDRLNEVVRDLKRMAMSFNRGQGIAVVGLSQINREGFKTAEKNDGNYNLTNLAYANEIERSSDIVTASYVNDDLRQENKVRFQCLKSRDQAPFQPFYARVEWPYRRLITAYEEESETANTAQRNTNNGVRNLSDLMDDL